MSSPSPVSSSESSAQKKLVRPWRFKLFLIIVFIVGIVLWSGLNRTPPNFTTPLVLHGEVSPSPLESPTLKVASFNIHGGKGTDHVTDLSRIAGLLKGFDLVGLYEVHSQQLGYKKNMAAAIGDELEMASVFAATEHRWWHDHFGNGLLTKTKLLNLQRIPLSGTQGKRYRCAILSRFVYQGKPVNLLCVHIDRLIDRDLQLKQVTELFLSLEAPAILMGDFNSWKSNPHLQKMLQQPGVIDCIEEVAGDKKYGNHVDWIFARGFQSVDARLVENDASDHHLIWAEFKLLPEK